MFDTDDIIGPTAWGNLFTSVIKDDVNTSLSVRDTVNDLHKESWSALTYDVMYT